MPKDRGVRIVKKPGNRSGRDVDVFDLETGEHLKNVHRIQIDITRSNVTALITLTTGDDWVYEGPAEFTTLETQESM